ncbi:ABC transporter ATP-binding protein [Methyloraptor flagellatus]|uniref:ATP-binding cassette domain-containing protein n=1 Tax=Methyloraptor flagellatus TaxID=3162530 RepID=A0AAU7X979_9HYPH
MLEHIAVDHRDAGGAKVRALEIDRFAVAAGERVVLTGPSGAGKTTALHVAAGIARPDTGRVQWGDRVVSAEREAVRDRWRRETIGFVFQNFHLVPELDILSNILIARWFSAWRVDGALRARAVALAERMGLPDPRRRAGVLSRGEQQRVAIARALVHRPAIVFADEPTASLDAETGAVIGTLLVEAVAETGASLVAVSHDARLIERFPRVVQVLGGRLVEDAPALPRISEAAR